MNLNRTHLLLGVAAVLSAVVVVRFLLPDGTISVDFKNAPLSKVIVAFERQGGIDLMTNIPVDTPVTIQLKRAPLMDALETLAVRVEGDVRPLIVGAPTRKEALAGAALFETTRRPEKWEVAWFPTMGFASANTPSDARSLLVSFQPGEKKDLHASLQQISAKSGLMTAVPQEWNPAVDQAATTGEAAAMVRSIARAAKGETVEVFLLQGRGGGDRNAQGGPGSAPGADGGRRGDWGGPGGGGGRPDRMNMNPEWMAERAKAAIAALPPAERPAAQAEFDAMQAIWAEIRSVPEDQRRDKMMEVFSRPEVQDMMAEREAARDARRTPEQRSERYQRYVERKQQALQGGQP